MILLGGIVGWLIGGVLNWAADFLPRHAAARAVAAQKSSGQFAPALWQLLNAFTVRANRARLPKSLWLNLGIELFTAAVCAYLLERYGFSWNWVSQTLWCSFFILVAIIDLRYRLVLNVLVFPAAALSLLILFLSPGTNLLAVLIGGAFGFAIFALAAFLRPGELGAGDVKLATLIGLILGFPNVLWALMLGVLTGGIVVVALLSSHRGNLKTQIPYAPFLCLGAMVALVYSPLALIFHSYMGR